MHFALPSYTKLLKKIRAALNAGSYNRLAVAASYPPCHPDEEHEWKRSN